MPLTIYDRGVTSGGGKGLERLSKLTFKHQSLSNVFVGAAATIVPGIYGDLMFSHKSCYGFGTCIATWYYNCLQYLWLLNVHF